MKTYIYTQRASSITTRIKTQPSNRKRDFWWLREHLPLQQGLRPCLILEDEHVTHGLREHLPLQQGLRQPREDSKHLIFSELREHLPLQQGLRLVLTFGVNNLHVGSESIFHYNKD